MSTFTIGAAEFKNSRKSDFQEFIEIAKGRSIISAGDWSDGRFELGLSGGLMLRIFSDAPAEVNVITTVNPGEIPPLLVALGDLPQQVPLHVLEDKLRGLRTLHAVYFLLNSGRGKKLTQYLYKNPDGDIERDLLNEEDRLFVESVSYGSWILALWAKTKRAFSAVSSVAGLVFERGREAFLRRLEAEARLLENQADTESIELAQKTWAEQEFWKKLETMTCDCVD